MKRVVKLHEFLSTTIQILEGVTGVLQDVRKVSNFTKLQKGKFPINKPAIQVRAKSMYLLRLTYISKTLLFTTLSHYIQEPKLLVKKMSMQAKFTQVDLSLSQTRFKKTLLARRCLLITIISRSIVIEFTCRNLSKFMGWQHQRLISIIMSSQTSSLRTKW